MEKKVSRTFEKGVARIRLADGTETEITMYASKVNAATLMAKIAEEYKDFAWTFLGTEITKETLEMPEKMFIDICMQIKTR